MGSTSGDSGPAFVDDSISDWAGHKMPEGERNRRIGTTVKKRTTRAVLVLMVASLCIIAVRAGQVQIVRGEHYAGLAEGNRSRIEWIPAERGVMVDRDGEPVVGNAPRFTVTVTPADLPLEQAERRNLLGKIAVLLDINPRAIERELEKYENRTSVAVPVAENVEHDKAVLTDIFSLRNPAVQLVKGVRREYYATKETASMSHIIGFEGSVSSDDLATGNYLPTDRVGRTGLERSYEDELRGSYGRRRIEVDALGSRKTVIAEESGIPGSNLVLSIDMDLQRKAEQVLRDSLDGADAESGSLIALRPGTGEILSMVSLPAFDNNKFAKGIASGEYRVLTEDKDKPLFNRAIGASLPSGSTFKLVVAAAALAEGVVRPETTFLSAGGIAVGRWFFPDWKVGGHGLTNLYKAISESVNTYFYIIGGGYKEHDGLGVSRIIEYARKFGLGQKTGIDIPGEGKGFLPSKEWKMEAKGERWYDGDTYHLSIGQGDLLVTPLQIANMTAVFANGGDLIQPRLVNKIVSPHGSEKTVESEILNSDVVDEEHIDHVRKGMRNSVLYGSSRSLSVLPVSAAGKTGTAQWSRNKDTHAWFTSFAPYQDPEIVLTVVVEEGGEGSSVAAPIARDVLKWYFEPEPGQDEEIGQH